ncbi:MAG: L-threonine kinase [Eubacteriales bacterium]|nr:L-threonine kinase [Eubacteriales bacterium]MDN5363964.1 L-threonine kinase [Eubacteriales bacterium]
MYVVRAPGTCGELVQGTIEGKNFHVTCPVALYSYAWAEKTKGHTITVVEEFSLPFCPVAKEETKGERKSSLATRHSEDHQCFRGYDKLFKALEIYLGGKRRRGIRLHLYSQLPRGKGMASSTADICASLAAVSLCLEEPLSPQDIARIALTVEPSDGVMFDGLAMFDHVRGETLELLGQVPPLQVLLLDLGGMVDSEEFNRRGDLEYLNRKKERRILRAMSLLRYGLEHGDLKKIAQAATISAFANQDILPKPSLAKIWHTGRIHGAIGMNVAHSGTVVGLLFPPGKEVPAEQIVSALPADVGIKAWHLTTMVDGGLEVYRGERKERSCLWERYSSIMEEI